MIKKILTLQLNFLRASIFDLHTDDSNPIFQSVDEKRVHHETWKRFWDNLPTNFRKNFVLQNRKFTSPFSFDFLYNLKPAYTISSLWNFDVLKQYYLFTPKHFPDRPLIIPQECDISTESAQLDPDCILAIVAHPYPQLSEVFDQPLNEKALIFFCYATLFI